MLRIKFLYLFLFFTILSSAQQPFSTYRSSFVNADYDIMISERNNGIFTLWISAISLDNPSMPGGFVVREKDYFKFVDALGLAKKHYEDLVDQAKKNNITEQYKSLRVFANTDAFFYKEQWNYQYDLSLNFEFFADTVGQKNRYFLVLNSRALSSNIIPVQKSAGFNLVFSSVSEIDDFLNKISYDKVNAHVLKGDTVGLFSTKRRSERINRLASRTGFFANTRFAVKVGNSYSFNMNSLGDASATLVNSTNTSMDNCFDFGFTGRYSFNKLFVQMGASYLFGNVNYTYAFLSQERKGVDYKRSLHFKAIDIPFALGYSFFVRENSRFSIMAGPKMRINIGSTNEDIFFSTYADLTLDEINQSIDPLLLGVDVGLQYELYRLKFGLNFNLMNDISRIYVPGIEINATKANAFNINIGWEL